MATRAGLGVACVAFALGAWPAAADDAAPSIAAWAGARTGPVIPLGSFTGGPPWPKLVGAGMEVEADLGVRIDRCNAVYGFGSYAALGHGSGVPPLTFPLDGGDSANVYARSSGGWTWSAGLGIHGSRGGGGVRALGDLALSYRQLAAQFEDGSSARLDAYLDLRLGAGVQWRLSDSFALSALAQLTVPTFHASGELLLSDGTGSALATWARMPYLLGFVVGAHFDLPGANNCGDCFLQLENP